VNKENINSLIEEYALGKPRAFDKNKSHPGARDTMFLRPS